MGVEHLTQGHFDRMPRSSVRTTPATVITDCLLTGRSIVTPFQCTAFGITSIPMFGLRSNVESFHLLKLVVYLFKNLKNKKRLSIQHLLTVTVEVWLQQHCILKNLLQNSTTRSQDILFSFTNGNFRSHSQGVPYSLRIVI